MTKNFALAGGLALALAALAACSQQEGTASGAQPAYRVVGINDTAVASENGVIRATRAAGDRTSGVVITQAPVAMTFSVEGEGARLRVRRGGRMVWVPIEESNTIVLGRDDVSGIRVYSTTAQEISVRVTDVTDCSERNDGPCAARPLREAAEPADEAEEAAPAPAAP